MTADVYDFSSEKTQSREWSLGVYTTSFWGEKVADLCKLRFAPSGER